MIKSVRVALWHWSRNRPVLRRLVKTRLLGSLLRRLSDSVVPGGLHRLFRIRSGLGEGLVFDIHPRWEHPVWNGVYETEVQAVLDGALKPGISFYDVGGGMGFYACCAARRGARVFVFEPDEENARCIERHLRINRLAGSVYVQREALFSRSGTVSLRVAPQRYSHGNAIVDQGGERRVPSVTLDSFCVEHPPPDICKVDVEGSEFDVLEGAEATFAAHSILLVCEVHDARSARVIERWLARLGYSSRWLRGDSSFPRHLVAERGAGIQDPLL